MVWLKALHIIFTVTWFAGLFYLPRLFVYHAAADDALGRVRFQTMERKLFAMMTIGAALTVVSGLALLLLYWLPGLAEAGWLHAKLALVAALVAYHLWCWKIVRDLRTERDRHSPRWFRWFNEAPSLLLIAIVILAVVKPL
ncbi:MAG: CopD family protein [Gammaproteobacteria bacterium]|nr:CopD family protein [Gammaproteobacteria bacterium]